MKNTTRALLCSLIIGIFASMAHSQEDWASRWLTDPSTTDDKGKRICVDKRGNSYVAGLTNFDGAVPGLGTGQRVEVIKYSPAGVEIWTLNLGPSSSISKLGNIVTDDDYVYFCTAQPHSGTGDDIYVYKRKVSDGTGSSSWSDGSDGTGVRRFNSGSTNNDVAADIALDSAGNVFVAGHCPGSDGTDLWLIKIELDGDTAWDDTYDASASSSNEVCVAMDTLPNGTTVVAGTSTVSGLDKWCAMRWNGGGSQTMSSGVSYNLNSDDAEVTDVAISSSGDVFLCGYLKPSSAQCFAVGGFDGDDGSHGWHKSDYAGKAYAIAVWLDFVYATGVYNETPLSVTDPENLTVKLEISDGDYSSTWSTGGGQSVAGARFYNASDGYTDRGHAIVLAGDGNCYVTGVTSDFSSQQAEGAFPKYHTLCWDQGGNLDLDVFYDGSTGSKMEDRAWGIGLVGAGVINVTGESEGNVNLGPFDFATLQYRRYTVAAAGAISTIWGTLISGDLASVQTSNDTRYNVEENDPTEAEVTWYPVDIQATGTVPTSGVSELSLHLEARTDSSLFRQIVLFYNYDNDQWDEMDNRIATVLQDSLVEVRVMGDPEPYINDTNGQVKVRIGFALHTGDTEGWQGQIDHLEWHYVQ